MSHRKSIRTRGKIGLSKYFQEFKEGDSVAVVRDISVDSKVPKSIQGRTGVVKEKRGRAYVVEIKDHDKKKSFLVSPIHLKKIKQIKKNDKK